MKKFLFSVTLSSALVLSACGGAEEEEQNADQNDTGTDETEQTEETTDEQEETEEDASDEKGSEEDLTSGVEEVQSTLNSLSETAENSSDNPEDIQSEGKKLEESWDAIEKQVEEEYPDDYTNIEESLYPLIDEAKADEPDTDSIQDLTEETQDKLDEFLSKIEKEE
ncbi:hypothetical protein ACE1TI_14315 [Alteribacillus sp. JSM 102045]|uniref:hypothetical protein n=1 Tax=Alteribacillus sp. JSM 102045 TaxID=1562101 RepID=UPI0035BF0D22